MKKLLTRIFFLSELSPFLELWGKKRMKYCQQDISKSICPKSLKLGQLIEDDLWITGLTCEQIPSIFSELCPFENLDIVNFSVIYLNNYMS